MVGFATLQPAIVDDHLRFKDYPSGHISGKNVTSIECEAYQFTRSAGASTSSRESSIAYGPKLLSCGSTAKARAAINRVLES
jgi:hypothetical protein